MSTYRRKRRGNGQNVIKLKKLLDEGPVEAREGKELLDIHTSSEINRVLKKAGVLNTKLPLLKIWIWHYPSYKIDIKNFDAPKEGEEDTRTPFQKKISHLIKTRGYITRNSTSLKGQQKKKRVSIFHYNVPVLSSKRMQEIRQRYDVLSEEIDEIIKEKSTYTTITKKEFDEIVKNARKHSQKNTFFESEEYEILYD